MEGLLAFIASVSIAAWIVVGAAAAAIVVAVAILVSEGRFRRFVRAAALAPETVAGRKLGSAGQALRRRYVLGRARSGFRGAPGPFPELPLRLGYGESWMASLERGGDPRSFSLALEFLPDAALFSCFLAALRKEALGSKLLAWMDSDEGAFALRRIALAAPGRAFDAEAARRLFSGKMDEIRELLGDPEWAVRVLAVRMLLGTDDERSARSLESCFSDPHPLVRRLVLEEWDAPDRDAFYATLYGILASDTSLEVRKAAKARILEDFKDRYAPDLSDATSEQVLHVLELLDPTLTQDEELAFRYLEKGGTEERLAAAECLDSGGALARIFSDPESADEAELERRFALLDAAANSRSPASSPGSTPSKRTQRSASQPGCSNALGIVGTSRPWRGAGSPAWGNRPTPPSGSGSTARYWRRSGAAAMPHPAPSSSASWKIAGTSPSWRCPFSAPWRRTGRHASSRPFRSSSRIPPSAATGSAGENSGGPFAPPFWGRPGNSRPLWPSRWSGPTGSPCPGRCARTPCT